MEISSSPPLTDLDRESFFSYSSQEVEELRYPEDGHQRGDECDYLVFGIGEKEKGSEEGEEGEVCLRGETEGEDERRGVVEGEEDGRGEVEGAEEGGEVETEVEDKGKVGELEAEDERSRKEEEVDEWITGMLGEMKEDVLCFITEDPPSSVVPSGTSGTTSQEPWGHNLNLGDDLSDSLQVELAVVCSDSEDGEDQRGASPFCDVTSQVEGGGAAVHGNESKKEDIEEEEVGTGGEEEEKFGTGGEEEVEVGTGGEEEVVVGTGGEEEEKFGTGGEEEVEVGTGGEEEVVTGGEEEVVVGTGGEVEVVTGGEEEVVTGGEEEAVTGGEVEAVTGGEEEVGTGGEEGEERMSGRDDDEEEMKAKGDLLQTSPSVSSAASLTDLDRRVPPDFSVKQENLSENVSTEHVDFMLARQQWKKMEEEVKGQPIPKPGLTVQGNFQGTHSSLYPPTRSPRLKHREIQPSTSKDARPSSLFYPSDEDSWNETLRSPLEEPESAVEREIRRTLEREEQHRRERGMILQGVTLPRPSTLPTARSPPRPPACRTPTLSISPSPSFSSSLPRSMYHEMTANNVIILEPDSSSSASRNRLLSSGIGGRYDLPGNLDAMSPGNVIVVETSNLIIRSTSEFCLSSAPASVETQESTFTSNPFFKLRSISSQSLVEQEIKMVRHREEEWRRQRDEMWRRKREEEWRRGRERYDTVLVSPGLHENISLNEVPDRSVSSPSSPSRSRKMERSSLSCDHKFPLSLSSGPRRQNAMAQRWEASLLANQKKE